MFRIISNKPLRLFVAACGLFPVLVLLYAWKIEPDFMVVRTVDATVPSLAKNRTIVFMADLHLPMRKGVEQKLFRELGRIRPDLILIGGDFSSYHAPTQYSIDKLNEIARYGKTVMVLGNTDICRSRQCIYCFLRYPQDRLATIPGSILRNQVLDLPDLGFRIVGLDDPVTKLDDTLVLQPAPPPWYNILLLHSGYKLTANQIHRFDLICSGHTHGGQVFFARPFLHRFDPAVDQQHVSGVFHLDKTVMAVTSGVGESFLPIRFGVPPEIMVFHLSKAISR
jgi:hypothetical protein